MPSAKIFGGQKFSIINDYIGRPVQSYDDKGNLVWETDYDIYGDLRNLKGDRSFIPFRQLGQYEDVETGLSYNRFRYYDNETGLYLSQDPIGLAGNNPNFYAYVHDSNIWVDLFGLAGLYDIHSVTQPDIVTKGLHFYGKNNVELAVRPNSNGGISFKSPFSAKNLLKSDKLNLQSAIKDAEKKFTADANWRKSIMENAASGKKVLVESFGDDALGAMARGRSAELNFIEKNIKKMCK